MWVSIFFQKWKLVLTAVQRYIQMNKSKTDTFLKKMYNSQQPAINKLIKQINKLIY